MQTPEASDNATQQLRPGRYRHYKGNLYYLAGVVRHSETLESLVLYRALYGERAWWVRPLSMFRESVLQEGVLIPRFAYLDAGKPEDGTPLEAQT